MFVADVQLADGLATAQVVDVVTGDLQLVAEDHQILS